MDKLGVQIKDSLKKISANDCIKRKMLRAIKDKKEIKVISKRKKIMLATTVTAVGCLSLLIGAAIIKNSFYNDDIIGKDAAEENNSTTEIARVYYNKTLNITINGENYTYINTDPFNIVSLNEKDSKLLGEGEVVSDHDTPQIKTQKVYFKEDEQTAIIKDKQIYQIVYTKDINDSGYNQFIIILDEEILKDYGNIYSSFSNFYGGFNVIYKQRTTSNDGTTASMAEKRTKLSESKIYFYLQPQELTAEQPKGSSIDFFLTPKIIENAEESAFEFKASVYSDGYLKIIINDEQELIFKSSKANALLMNEAFKNNQLNFDENNNPYIYAIGYNSESVFINTGKVIDESNVIFEKDITQKVILSNQMEDTKTIDDINSYPIKGYDRNNFRAIEYDGVYWIYICDDGEINDFKDFNERFKISEDSAVFEIKENENEGVLEEIKLSDFLKNIENSKTIENEKVLESGMKKYILRDNVLGLEWKITSTNNVFQFLLISTPNDKWENNVIVSISFKR